MQTTPTILPHSHGNRIWQYGSWVTLFCLSAGFFISAGTAWGQLDFEGEPINYNTAAVTDNVSRLQERLDNRRASLDFDSEHGYLRSVLEQLDVSVSSQVLVFSKTSFQLRRITPQKPRALYFNDDVYIGWVQGGDVVEVSSADPNQGALFYTLRQEQSDSPKFVRDRGQCIVCHASSRTAGVPGHLVRSVLADRSGLPLFGAGTFTIDHRSPFKQRWGGWYVTGTHGHQRHLGNVTVKDREHPEEFDPELGANVTDLAAHFRVSRYLGNHSDIVALMVLEHQTQMHNLITRANFETRSALHYDDVMNRAVDRPLDHRSDSTVRRIASAGDKLTDYMLFAGELVLTEPIEGTSDYRTEFTARGPRDKHGRSLREFDLKRRLMKYPCSYLIYSKPFDRLPDLVKQHVYRRLFDVLSGVDTADRFQHLTTDDRLAILEILRDTKSDLPGYWYSGN